VDGSVTTAKIADNAITSAKLGFDVIVAEDIAANAITVSEIQNGAVTPAKLSTGGPAWDADGNVSTQSGGDLTFTGTGNRITGDFSNGTQTNRVVFQTSTTNGNSIVGVLPNGTATTSVFRAFNNADPTNASEMSMFASSATNSIISGITGTGTYLPLTMLTGGSERLRIDTSGNVGVGTSSPSYRLHVAGPSGDYRTAIFETASTNGPSVQIKGSKIYELRSTNSGAGEGGGLFFIYDKDNEASRLTINSSGVTAIKFAASQVASADANTLDDYEEGTWTPEIWTSGGQITSPSSVAGTYIKIGRMLYIQGYWYKSSGTSGGNSGYTLRGLPFSISTNYDFIPLGYNAVNGSISTQPGRFQANTSSYLDMYGQFSSTAWSSSYIELSFCGVLRTTS
jgi:hypothetical protein